MSVYESLPVGKENAISADDLYPAFGFTDRRQFTKLVERERRSGKLICSSGDGYYRPASAVEAAGCIKSLCRRRTNLSRTIVYMENALAKYTGQESLFTSSDG